MRSKERGDSVFMAQGTAAPTSRSAWSGSFTISMDAADAGVLELSTLIPIAFRGPFEPGPHKLIVSAVLVRPSDVTPEGDEMALAEGQPDAG